MTFDSCRGEYSETYIDTNLIRYGNFAQCASQTVYGLSFDLFVGIS
ncbi:hypothetical protein CGMCC3_g14871 [Colletotrichum fructicola]|nr:uncharacterized protein CGMCC3_g14871 [Colletotrichum fructicola]KAE9569046.1 hypothetical protein CGMCC3_g14871 [Colletotrichum fructicola]